MGNTHVRIFTLSNLTVAIGIIGFKIQQFHVLSAEYIYVFYVYLRTKEDFCCVQYYLIGFYNRGLLRGTIFIFK